MHTTTAKVQLLDPRRLDPDFYRKEFLEIEENLHLFGCQRLAQVGKFFAGPFGSELPSRLYLTEGVPLFRVGNVGSMEVLWKGMAHLAPAVHASLGASRVLPGDILVVKASVGEKICRIPDTIAEANITQHIIAIRLTKGIDPDFLCAFLFSKYGRKQFERRSLGSIIQYLGIADAKSVVYPTLSVGIQEYIGTKIRIAAALRSFVVATQSQVEKAFEKVLGSTPSRWVERLPVRDEWNNGSFRTKVNASALRGRLDPSGYHPQLQQIVKHAATVPHVFSRLADVCDIVTDERKRHSSKGDCDYSISVLHVDNDGYVDVIGAGTNEPESGGRECKRNDILYSCINPIANRVAVCCVDNSICSPEFSILRCKGSYDPYVVAHAIRSAPSLNQLVHLGHGTSSSRRRVDESELNALWIPVGVYDTGHAKLLERMQYSSGYAARLVVASTSLIEGLVEQHIPSDVFPDGSLDRVTYEKKDRAIMSRLYEGGIDATDTRPLFPDLDAYYETLQSVEQVVAKGGEE
jgi:hypothetical protein